MGELGIAGKRSNLLKKIRFGSGSAQCSQTFFSRFSHEPDLGPIADIRCIGKCGRCDLPLGGGKSHRHFHSSAPDSQYPKHRKLREVQLAAQRRQVAPTFPLIDADLHQQKSSPLPKKVRFGFGFYEAPVHYATQTQLPHLSESSSQRLRTAQAIAAR